MQPQPTPRFAFCCRFWPASHTSHQQHTTTKPHLQLQPADHLLLLLRFQLLGIACLRTAMVDTRGKLPAPETEVAEEAAVNQDPLAPERFAHVSDRTYTTEQVSIWARLGSIPHHWTPGLAAERFAQISNSNSTTEQIGYLAPSSATKVYVC